MLAGQNRVHSIGIVHQKLYQGTKLGAIEMKDYFINLVKVYWILLVQTKG